MKVGRLSIFSLILALLTLCGPAWGQATTSLHGTVTDPSGAAIPNAKVTITDSATGVTHSTVTNATGAYSFPSVNPGNYDLVVTAEGFQTAKQSGLGLRVSLPATSDIKLNVGSVSTTVQVSGHAPLLNTTDATVGNTMGTTSIENLPMRAESMPLLLSFQPGVVYNGQNALQSNYDTRAGSVNGERSDQNNITLDGVSNNYTFAGYAFNGVLPTTPFSTQEFRVTTSNYTATQGRSAGAQITMVTKSGTNQFHGNLYEFNRNTLGEANDWFNKGSQISSGLPNRPSRLVRNVFGGDVGGPFIHNKAFFFFNYEGHRIASATSVLRIIPSMTLRNGIIEYTCTDAASCPGGSVTGLGGNSYAVPAGSYALNATQLKNMDPLGIGPSQVALTYFDTYPTPNTANVLDAPNYAGYRFSAPIQEKDNWYIGRIDYVINNSNSFFVRGTAVHDRSQGAPFLPGQAPETQSVDFSKGIAAGLTTTFNPNVVNDLRYGLTKESVGSDGNSNQPWIYMRDLDQGVTRTSASTTPVNNIVDTVSWQHGSHKFQFGGNLLLIRREDATDANSFSDALTNADWTTDGGFAGKKGNPLNPATSGYPDVKSAHAYDFPLAAMMGMASEVDTKYNYKVTSQTAATPLSQGATVVRNWATNTYDLYFNDTWQARPDLSITYGLNYQLMTPITEVNGQQVEPNMNMGKWFQQRAINAANGVPSNQDALIKYAPAGSYWGKDGMYSMQTKNFAPRVGFAWTPRPAEGWLRNLTGDGMTSVRGGFGMYYDNFGPALAERFDASGSVGLSTTLESPFGISIADTPRITGMHDIPTTDNSGNSMVGQAPPSTYPVTYPVGAEAIGTGIDQSLRTPYSYAMDLSVQRQLPAGIVLDVAYVGHMGRHGLALDDLAMPANLVDPKTGISYFAAATAMAKLTRQGAQVSQVTAQMLGPTAAYWTDMFTEASAGFSSPYCKDTSSATDVLQAAYAWMSCKKYNETSALYSIDVHGRSLTPVGGLNSYYNSQFSSLWAWRSMSNSSYNSLQVSLHKRFSHGLLFGFNYTYSHSLDEASFAERAAHFLTSSVINAWNPSQMYSSSAFDVRHQINGYWVEQLPIGRGKMLAGNAGRALDAVVGGWQLAGTTRWTSGFPFSVFMGYVWPTNWDEMGWANLTKPVATGTTIKGGAPYVFKDPSTAGSSFDYAYPGQSGQRNNIRGEGYFDTDANLSKSFHTFGKQTFQIRWQVFNVFNTHRFDVQSIQDEVDAGPAFGQYTGLLTDPREMEFGGVYTF